MLRCRQCEHRPTEKESRSSSSINSSHPSHRMSRHTTSGGHPVTWFMRRSGVMILGLFLLGMASPVRGSSGYTITAFEYQRKFNKNLNLGECPNREVEVRSANNATRVQSEMCHLYKPGTVHHDSRKLQDSRNVVINSTKGIVKYLGLCGGEAASFLGILVSGDCVAVDIASKLTFNRKTLIRAYVGLYQKSLDVLDSKTNETVGMVRDKVYLKNRSYGSMDLIIVQFRFRNGKLRNAAQGVKLLTNKMSDYMIAIERNVGRPKAVTVINMCTAQNESFTFKVAKFRAHKWERAVRHVQVAEHNIKMMQRDIDSNQMQPHLKYRLFPFVASESGSLRNSQPRVWENTSVLEVELKHALSSAKKTARRCRGDRTPTCKRVRGLRRNLTKLQRELHDTRSRWVDLSKERKIEEEAKYRHKVERARSFTVKITRRYRSERRQAKLKALKEKQDQEKSLNQIPKPIRQRPNRIVQSPKPFGQRPTPGVETPNIGRSVERSTPGVHTPSRETFIEASTQGLQIPRIGQTNKRPPNGPIRRPSSWNMKRPSPGSQRRPSPGSQRRPSPGSQRRPSPGSQRRPSPGPIRKPSRGSMRPPNLGSWRPNSGGSNVRPTGGKPQAGPPQTIVRVRPGASSPSSPKPHSTTSRPNDPRRQAFGARGRSFAPSHHKQGTHHPGQAVHHSSSSHINRRRYHIRHFNRKVGSKRLSRASFGSRP